MPIMPIHFHPLPCGLCGELTEPLGDNHARHDVQIPQVCGEGVAVMATYHYGCVTKAIAHYRASVDAANAVQAELAAIEKAKRVSQATMKTRIGN